MVSIEKYQNIASLIVKEKLVGLNDSEADELKIWLEESPKHKILYNNLLKIDFSVDLNLYDEIDSRAGLLKYKKKQVQNKKYQFVWYGGVVAVVAVFVVCLGIMWIWNYNKSHVDLNTIVPGTSMAELVLSDGSVRYLNEESQEVDAKIDGAVIYNRGSELYYATTDSVFSEQKMVYNELRVPIGAEYQLILSDGTKVWLNSQSYLRYPVFFLNNNREVELIGEAFFEVAPDTKRPFFVRLNNHVSVEVLGTSFNVRSYPDEENIETVLEQGKVRMGDDKSHIVLKAGMRAVYKCAEKDLTAEKVNTALYTSWRLGHFVFQEERLESILNRLSKWYNIQVFFSNKAAKDLIFSGNIRRYETIVKLLDALEISGNVDFDIQEETVIVTMKKK